MSTIVFLQARMSSTRLPKKTLMEIGGKPLLEIQIERVRKSRYVDDVVVLTSQDPEDDILEDFCKKRHLQVFRGELFDVLDRFYQASLEFKPNNIVRITGDCPLIDPQIIDEVVLNHLNNKNDYTSNVVNPTFPDGMDVEIFSFDTLSRVWSLAQEAFYREHVTSFIYSNPLFFKIGEIRNEDDKSDIRLTVDELEDFQVIEKLFSITNREVLNMSCREIVKVVLENNLNLINAFERNEGALLENDDMRKRYQKSTELYHEVKEIIPLASQTFSKSVTQYSLGTSPLFCQKAKGAYIWDVDGNRYLDFVNGLLSVNLGYRYDKVDQQVISQIKNSGVNFSLPHLIESEVAKKIIEMVPCAQMVRFGKNGTDATSAAVRISRAYTGKTHIAVCGYHGWQDWYIRTTTMNKGIPESQLTKRFEYNKIESLERLFEETGNDIAAVIMEPMNTTYPENSFLQKVKDLCHRNGAVFVLDEMITGFRFAKGGAQEYFGVTPDLATFGKGVANGYPLSVICGKKDIMMEMEKVFFSGTFGGEAVSLSAASAVLDILNLEDVVGHIKNLGQLLINGFTKIVQELELEDILYIPGHPSWTFLGIRPNNFFDVYELKSFILQELYKRGILSVGSHNISFSHTEKHIEQLLRVYQDIFSTVRDNKDKKSLSHLIQGNVIRPLFTVR